MNSTPSHAGHVRSTRITSGGASHGAQQHERRLAAVGIVQAGEAELGQQAQAQAALEAVVLHQHDVQIGQAHRAFPEASPRL
jgi:hypothetical protein